MEGDEFREGQDRQRAWQDCRLLILVLNGLLMISAFAIIGYGAVSGTPLLIAVGGIYLALPGWIIHKGLKALSVQAETSHNVQQQIADVTDGREISSIIINFKGGIE